VTVAASPLAQDRLHGETVEVVGSMAGDQHIVAGVAIEVIGAYQFQRLRSSFSATPCETVSRMPARPSIRANLAKSAQALS
jgi:hypothetical protein